MVVTVADWADSLFKFLGPILQSALSSAASTGVNKIMAPPVNGGDPGSIRQGIQSGQFSREGLQSGAQTPGGGPGLIPGMPPGVSGSGTTNNPSGGMSFGGGYTGGPTPDPNMPSGPPSSGFTTMGFPKTDQSKLKQGLRGDSGFQGI